MLKLGFLIFVLCVVSSFSANFELKIVSEKFRKAFNESSDSIDLKLNEEDKKFYHALRSLISSQETEALILSLEEVFEEYDSEINEANEKVKILSEQLSVISEMIKSNVDEEELNKYSKLLLESLNETVDFVQYSQLKPITFTNVYLRQNVQFFYSELKMLAKKLHEISGNGTLGNNFVNAITEKGEFKIFEMRNQLIENQRSKRSTKKILAKLGYFACKVLEILTKYGKFEKYIANFIIKYVPEEHQSEFISTLLYKGIVAVTNLARKFCGQDPIQALLTISNMKGIEQNYHVSIKPRSISSIYIDLFPKNEVDFELFKTFVEWYRLSLENAFDSIKNEIKELSAEMKQDIQKVRDDMSKKGNEILMVYSGELKMDQILKLSIRALAIELKNRNYY